MDKYNYSSKYLADNNNNNNNNNNNSVLYFYVLHEQLKGHLQTQEQKKNNTKSLN
jgi:hypothetical protein